LRNKRRGGSASRRSATPRRRSIAPRIAVHHTCCSTPVAASSPGDAELEPPFVFGAATSPDVVVVVLGTEVLVEFLGFVVVVVDRTVVDVLVDVVDVEPEVAVQHEELALAGDCQWFASPVPPVVS
jgi:hypothetical protein